MEIIVPCAGMSTRFPNLRPKYLLTDYRNKLMIEESIKNYIGKHNVTVAILDMHDKKFKSSKKLKEVFGDLINIVVLPNPTNGPADTIYQTLKTMNIDPSVPFMIKDCDSYFDSDIVEGNVIYVSTLTKNPNMRNAAAKSYTITNDQNIINSVVEKQIVSESFCCGGYQFDRAEDFIKSYEIISDSTNEIFVSNVIDYMIGTGSVFIEKDTDNFVDVGVSDDWFEYNNRPTYFCDIDGTIIKSLSDYNDPYEPLLNNVNKLKSELNRGCKIIYCTARPEKYKDVTRSMLNELGFESCDLIMQVHHSKRILINDFANSNPYPSAIAVNLSRDSDNLQDYLK
jgi:hypothetical protein